MLPKSVPGRGRRSRGAGCWETGGALTVAEDDGEVTPSIQVILCSHGPEFHIASRAQRACRTHTHIHPVCSVGSWGGTAPAWGRYSLALLSQLNPTHLPALLIHPLPLPPAPPPQEPCPRSGGPGGGRGGEPAAGHRGPAGSPGHHARHWPLPSAHPGQGCRGEGVWHPSPILGNEQIQAQDIEDARERPGWKLSWNLQ